MLKKGKRFYSDNFLLYYLPSDTLKVSPIVSKKISKKAVIRNKIKRRIRYIAYNLLSNGGFAIVAKKDISEYDFEKLYEEFKKLATKIN
ncbi:ribonuclease P protein component [Nautilia sp. PV-1]|uniref:ribonuclease P protein component n=1 Tax=Nautilia sp. PV-1 TaxID=2579250 RepID=UPI001FEE2A1D|nr:ribonuclease P protein component [Nautilia sp. PV-1]